MNFADLMAGYGAANRSEIVYVPDSRGFGARADADPLIASTRVNEVLTGYIQRSTPASDVDVAIKVFPVRNVSSYLIQYGKTKGEEMVLRNTERSAKAEISVSDSAFEEIIKKLRRFTHGWIWDEDSLLQASANGVDAWDLQFTGVESARQVVLRWTDKLAADLVNTTSGSTVYGLVQTGGAWSTLGTMLAEVNAAAEYLTGTTGRYKESFRLILFNNVRYLAERDPQFQELRTRTTSPGTPTLDDIAKYLGVGSVEHVSSTYVSSLGATAQFLFPSHAVLCYQGADAPLGERRWGQTFRWGAGAALNPYYVPGRTSYVYPYQVRQTTEIIDPTCAVAITSPT